MYKHLLIAVDGSAESDKALSQGLALAKTLSAKATVLTASEPWTEAAYATLPTPSMISAYEKSAAGNAANILTNAKQSAEGVGVHCEVRHGKDQHAPDAIIKLAKDKTSWQKTRNVILSLWDRMDAAASGGSFLAAPPSKYSLSANCRYSSATRCR
jgi:nucleotide-binding universal stress UspA family protein